MRTTACECVCRRVAPLATSKLYQQKGWRPITCFVRVGASFRTFVEMQNALHFFEQQTHSQFYMRDARTLNAAKKTTPNIAEKASKNVQYYFKYGLRLSTRASESMAADRISLGLGRRPAPDRNNRKYHSLLHF